MALGVYFGQQSFITVDKPGGLRTLCGPYGFADTPSEGVVLVAGGDLSVVLHGYPALCGVIGVGGDAAIARGAVDVACGAVAVAHHLLGLSMLQQPVAAGVLPFAGLVQAAGAVVHGVVAVLFLGQSLAGQAGAGAHLGQAVQRIVGIVNAAADVSAQLQCLARDAAVGVVLVAQCQQVGVVGVLYLDVLDAVEAVVGNTPAGARVLDPGGPHPLVAGPGDLAGAARLGGLLQVAFVVGEFSRAVVGVALAGFAAIGIPVLGQGGCDAAGVLLPVQPLPQLPELGYLR